jgi:phosphohistidine phosphatase
MTGQVADWSVKKAGVWWFRGRDREGSLQTVLQAVQNADNL